MPLNNISQLLFRNRDILKANTPLFINLLPDSFVAQYALEQPSAHITCYNTNFEYYQQFIKNKSVKIDCVFSAEYQTEKKHDLVIVNFPKSKEELNFTLAMIAHCVTEETKLLIVGENKGGIKSVNKLTQNTLTFCTKVDSARHCVLFIGALNMQTKKFNINDWYQYYDAEIGNIRINIASLPGVFSQKSLDKGSELLLNNLPKKMQGSVLDFGCGAGVIASFIGIKYPDVELSLVDISALALNSAQKTLMMNNITGNVFASNSLSEVNHKYCHVVSNPPFHQGLKTHYEATENFLKEVKRHLSPKGDITIVANNFLRYQPIMEKSIGITNRICNEKGFAIYHCRLN